MATHTDPILRELERAVATKDGLLAAAARERSSGRTLDAERTLELADAAHRRAMALTERYKRMRGRAQRN